MAGVWVEMEAKASRGKNISTVRVEGGTKAQGDREGKSSDVGGTTTHNEALEVLLELAEPLAVEHRRDGEDIAFLTCEHVNRRVGTVAVV